MITIANTNKHPTIWRLMCMSVCNKLSLLVWTPVNGPEPHIAFNENNLAGLCFDNFFGLYTKRPVFHQAAAVETHFKMEVCSKFVHEIFPPGMHLIGKFIKSISINEIAHSWIFIEEGMDEPRGKNQTLRTTFQLFYCWAFINYVRTCKISGRFSICIWTPLHSLLVRFCSLVPFSALSFFLFSVVAAAVHAEASICVLAHSIANAQPELDGYLRSNLK